MGNFWAGCGVLAICFSSMAAPPACAADRTANELLREIEAIEMPKLTSRDPTAIREYLRKEREALARRDELILELYRNHPDYDRVPELLIKRWENRGSSPSTASETMDEIGDFLAVNKGKDDRFLADAAYRRALAAMTKHRLNDPEAALPAIEDFIRRAPKDRRGATLLYSLGQRARGMPEIQTALHRRVVADYPDSMESKLIQGGHRRRDGQGSPILLEFNDAISGANISLKSMRGKIVVIDFWATWCGPCVAELPKLKDLYAKYHDQGVEFVGISLDRSEEEGGLKSLKDFVEKHSIPWPQYYQGNYWDSEFSRSWGINSIPAAFLVDRDGKLHSTEARGQLETMIPELLSKKREADNDR